MTEPVETTESVETTEQEPFDLDRAMTTIKTLRSEIKQYKTSLKDLEVLRTEKAQAEQAKLSEQERLSKELEQTKAELKFQQTEFQDRQLEWQLQVAAQKQGIVDPTIVSKIIDRSALEFDKEGKVTNLDTVLADLVKEKPYLAGQKPAVNGAANLNPTNSASRGATTTQNKPTYKREQFLDSAFYRANQKDMMAAMRENRIID